MEIQYFIFNYSYFKEALSLFNSFEAEGCDTFLLNCGSSKDPVFQETDKIKKLPNVYYSGQWNEALKLLTADVLFIVNSDVKIPSFNKLIYKMKNFYVKYGDKAGLYAPDHYWTPWTYNPRLLQDIGNGIKKVPSTDSTIWSLRADMARKVGPMDLKVNKLGWGIECLAAYYCSLENKLVVRDYSIKCNHPCSTSYNRETADYEWRKMVGNMNLGPNFWKYYDSRNKYGFGWNGKYQLDQKIMMI